MKPRIALVHDFIQAYGGAEKVLQVLAEIYPEAPIYTLTLNPAMGKFFDLKRIHTSYLQSWSWIPPRFFIGLYPKAIESFDFSNFDIIISSSNSFAKNILTPPHARHISYIHSPMRFAWDAAHTHLTNQAGRTPIGRAFGLVELIATNIISKLRLWDRLGADRVDTFIANSKNVADRIRKYYRKESIVIYPPVDVADIQASSTNEGYFLVLSRLVAYKRIDLAVQACEALGQPLVVAGTGPELDNLRKLAGPNTRFTGWISDEDKVKYLQGARAIIFPGEEDLGIVPIEAMAAGKPVIAYGKGGLLETVVAGESGIFFPEQTASSVQTAITKFIDTESSFDADAIHQHAEKYSKQNFVEQITQIVNNTKP